MNKQKKSKLLVPFLLIAVSLVHYLGGPYNLPIHQFYKLLYFIPIIVAAFQYGFKGGVVTSIISGMLHSPFILLTLKVFDLGILNEILDILLFFVIGSMAGVLAERKNLRLNAVQSELTRYTLLQHYTNGIIESIRNGVVSVNNDLLITMINQGARSLFCIERDCTGQPFSEIFSCCSSLGQTMLSSIEDGTPRENIEIPLGDFRETIVKVSLFPLRFDSVTKGLVIFAEDVTELKRLENQLVRNEKFSALGELSTGIAHEIRNPLGIIKAIEQTMKKELADNAEAVRELSIIDEEIERANRVVKELLALGKPTVGRMSIASLNQVLDDVLTISNKYLIQHGVTVTFEKSKIPEIKLDIEHLKQAFVNIIVNAVQAMEHGGKLTISTAMHNDTFVRISFTDTGPGIGAENLERIFNPFFTTKDDGTGLGLSIVQRIISEHKGLISARSAAGDGATFEILLPV